MAMLIEVDRTERASGSGCRPRSRSSAEWDVHPRSTEPVEGRVDARECPGEATSECGRVRTGNHEWLWLLSAGCAAFLVVLLLGLFGSTTTPAEGGAVSEVGSEGARWPGTGQV